MKLIRLGVRPKTNKLGSFKVGNKTRFSVSTNGEYCSYQCVLPENHTLVRIVTSNNKDIKHISRTDGYIFSTTVDKTNHSRTITRKFYEQDELQIKEIYKPSIKRQIYLHIPAKIRTYFKLDVPKPVWIKSNH